MAFRCDETSNAGVVINGESDCAHTFLQSRFETEGDTLGSQVVLRHDLSSRDTVLSNASRCQASRCDGILRYFALLDFTLFECFGWDGRTFRNILDGVHHLALSIHFAFEL